MAALVWLVGVTAGLSAVAVWRRRRLKSDAHPRRSDVVAPNPVDFQPTGNLLFHPGDEPQDVNLEKI